jgi:transposase
MTLFSLSFKERVLLEDIASSTDNANELRRLQALLWLDDGETTQAIALRLGVTRQTVYNWAARFQMRNHLDIPARLLDGPRSGRPRTALGIIDPIIMQVIESDPREFGFRSTVWTAPLLQQYLLEECDIVVSRPSVSLAIKRLEIRWKRPRHNLALRPTTWRQAKGA